MNLTALAKLAGVSVSTVSKAFSGSPEVGTETRERIFSLARENGMFDKYNKNPFPKKVVAVICPEWKSNYYKMFVTLLKKELDARQALMVVSATDFSAEHEKELFTYYAFYCKTDGIILISPHREIENPTHMPAVAIDPARDCRAVDAIRFDLRDATKKMVEFLMENGHRRIGFAGEKLTVGKQNTFLAAIRDACLPVRSEWIKTGNRRFEEAGIDCAEAWLREGTMPTAILAAYDDIAMGLVKTFRQHGVRVPDDVSIVGMDDIPEDPYLEPSLSSIRTHIALACRRAVETVLRKSENRFYSPREELTLIAEFIPRESIGPAPAERE